MFNHIVATLSLAERIHLGGQEAGAVYELLYCFYRNYYLIQKVQFCYKLL